MDLFDCNFSFYVLQVRKKRQETDTSTHNCGLKAIRLCDCSGRHETTLAPAADAQAFWLRSTSENIACFHDVILVTGHDFDLSQFEGEGTWSGGPIGHGPGIVWPVSHVSIAG